MTYEEATEYQWLVKEIALLQRQLSELEERYHVIAESNPKIRSGYNEVWRTLDTRMKACIAQCERFERWVSDVKNPTVRSYLYLRFVEGRTWLEIGIQYNCKQETVRMTVRRFFEKEAQRNEA